MPKAPRTPVEILGEQLLATRYRLSNDSLTPLEREREEIRLEALVSMIAPCKPVKPV